MAEDNGYSYLHGVVQDRTVFRATTQIDMLSNMNTSNASLIKWNMPVGNQVVFNMDWYCTRIAIHRHTDNLEFVYIGPDGRVGHSSSAGMGESHICPKGGPELYGVIRDLQSIGEAVYAVGMGRQVYRRASDGKWERRDAGVLQDPEDMDIVGFNAIHGLREDDFYAVGFSGEIWRCREGRWHQVESPTNVILNAVHVLPDGRVFAAGKNGVLIAGSADAWSIVETDIGGQIWDIQYFEGHIYLATSDALYCLNNDLSPRQVDMQLGSPTTCGQLHAYDGVLLSTGRKHQCWSNDGMTWYDIT